MSSVPCCTTYSLYKKDHSRWGIPEDPNSITHSKIQARVQYNTALCRTVSVRDDITQSSWEIESLSFRYRLRVCRRVVFLFAFTHATYRLVIAVYDVSLSLDCMAVGAAVVCVPLCFIVHLLLHKTCSRIADCKTHTAWYLDLFGVSPKAVCRYTDRNTYT